MAKMSTEDIKTFSQIEMESLQDMQTRILRVCFKKCITPKVKLGELEIGELTCIDRCVPKYVQAHELAQEEFRRLLPQQSGDAAGQ